MSVVEERLDPPTFVAVAHRSPLFRISNLRLRGRIAGRLELRELVLRRLGSFGFGERAEPVPLELGFAAIGNAVLLSLGRFVARP
jgi:hypothetical protein